MLRQYLRSTLQWLRLRVGCVLSNSHAIHGGHGQRWVNSVLMPNTNTNIIRLPKNDRIGIQILWGFPKMTDYEYHSSSQKWPNMVWFPKKKQIRNFRIHLLSSGENKQYECYVPFVVYDYEVQGGCFDLTRVEDGKIQTQKVKASVWPSHFPVGCICLHFWAEILASSTFSAHQKY